MRPPRARSRPGRIGGRPEGEGATSPVRPGYHAHALIRRAYEALLLDLDGTLLDDAGKIRPRTVESLRAVDARGVRVLIATGRSETGTLPILEELGFTTPAVVYNGACVYCPVERRFLEERVLSNRVVQRSLAHAAARDLYPVVMRSGAKFAPSPRSPDEQRAVEWLEELSIVPSGPLPAEAILRVTLFSHLYPDSGALAGEVEAAIGQPVYVTHFPLNALPHHRGSPLHVVDVHAPCRGKAEGLRVLQESLGIPAERVVAIGDADNDVPMLLGAGLGVAMRDSMASALKAADRVIGDNNSDAIAELIEELFAL